MKNILVIRPDAIGDVILAIPLLNSLKATYPNAKITIILAPLTEDILKNHPAIDKIITTKPAVTLDEIKSIGADMAIFPYSDKHYTCLIAKAKVPIRIADADRIALRKYLTHPVPQTVRDLSKHVAEQNIKLLKGYNPSAKIIPKPTLIIDSEDQEKIDKMLQTLPKESKRIGIHPSTGGHNKAISPQAFTSLINQIHEKTPHQVILTGAGKKECQIAEDIIKNCKTPPHNFAGKTTLASLKALINRCDIFIGSDTGPIHMAAALGVPVLCLSPTKFVKALHWGPWGSDHLIISDTSTCPLTCNPMTCLKTYCTDAIKTQDILGAMNDLLSGKGNKWGEKTSAFRSSMTLAAYITKEDELPELEKWLKKAGKDQLSTRIITPNKQVKKTIEAQYPNQKIKHIPRWNALKWTQEIAIEDITYIQTFTEGVPKVLSLYAQLAAPRMYVPPIIAKKLADSNESMVDMVLEKIRRKFA